jgi:hypothetical protein
MKTTLAALALVAASALSAQAAPVPVTQNPAEALAPTIEKVHFEHRSCQLGRRGWHFHNRFGDRLECRPFRRRL